MMKRLSFLGVRVAVFALAFAMLGTVALSAQKTKVSKAPKANKAAQTAKAGKIDPAGTWKWARQSRQDPTQVTTQTLKLAVVDGKLSGTVSSNFRREGSTTPVSTPIVNPVLKGSAISFSVEYKRNDQTYTIKFGGKIKGDTITGTMEMGSGDQARSTEWKARRVKAKSVAIHEAEHEPDVIFVPTPQAAVDKMLELAQVKSTDVVYDLGCGDGRIVVTAAKKFGCKAYGFDIDPQRIRESLANVEKEGVGDLVTIEQKDIFTLDLSKANVVTLYLLPSLNVRLIPQLEKLKPGSRIVSHDFDMEGVTPDQVVEVEDADGQDTHTIYFWTTPLKKTAAAEKK